MKPITADYKRLAFLKFAKLMATSYLVSCDTSTVDTYLAIQGCSIRRLILGR